jgi:LiaI-LiaF-like transmembrane region/B-box zinc finger
MKCAVHAEVDATGFCRNCGKALCPQCTREVKGALYCEECLAARVAAPTDHAHGPNPGAAFALGFIPGLGAVYNGEYIKGLIHVLIFGGLIVALNSDFGYEPLLGILLGVFCLYMPFEARRTAQLMLSGQKPTSFFSEGAEGRPMGAFVLIAIGVLFLLGNFGYLQEEWFRRGWPLILIGAGVYLLWKRSQNQ